MKEMLIGAVAYDPKVVTIWEGIRSYLRDDAKVACEIVLFLSYGAQVKALLDGRIDIGWNTNLAYLQAVHASKEACKAIAMRDTDVGWKTLLIAAKGGAVKSLDDVRGKKLALGSKDSGHAAILPVHFLKDKGLKEGTDYNSVRFNSDVGKHGDTGRSELEVLRAVLDGSADVGAVGSPFWEGIQDKDIAPKGAVEVIWESPAYNHCMFTARIGLEEAAIKPFTDALYAMDFDNPDHRPILEMEGLKQWVPPKLDGYVSLKDACQAQGLL